MNVKKRSIVQGIFSAILAALTISSGSVYAQFNVIYGGTGNEFGRSVHEIQNGVNAGNIVAVGEAPNPTAANTDIYIVMTNAAGARVGEWTIDFPGRNDFGKDFVEDANGDILITGYTTTVASPNTDAFVLKFSLTLGACTWARTVAGNFVTNNNTDEAYDIEKTANGYVIAGRSNSNHSTHYNAILFMIDNNGAWRWGTEYDGAGLDDGFFSVTQLADFSLIAAGYTKTTASTDVYMVRADELGNNITASRFGLATSDDGTRSVKPCDPFGPNANKVVVGGNTGNPGFGTSTSMLGLVDVGLTTLTGAKYVVAGQGWAETMGAMETPAPEYKIIMTGMINGAGTSWGYGNFDFYLSRVSSTLLALDWYRYHGGTLSDQGWAIDVANPYPGDIYSIIATGLRSTNANAQELDITSTNALGQMPCDRTQTPTITSFTWSRQAMPDCPELWGILSTGEVAVRRVTNTELFCPSATYRVSPETPTDGPSRFVDSASRMQFSSSVDDVEADGMSLSAWPNPVKRGSAFTIGSMTGSDVVMSVVISDVNGREIYRRAAENEVREDIEISTAGWGTGAYLVQITSGGKTMTRRIVVTD